MVAIQLTVDSECIYLSCLDELCTDKHDASLYALDILLEKDEACFTYIIIHIMATNTLKLLPALQHC